MIPDRVLFKQQLCNAEGLGEDGSDYDVTPEGRLRHAVTEDVRLPEEDWPTSPGDPWHGLVGTTKQVIIGWSPTAFTGPVRLRRLTDGFPIVLEFEGGCLRTVRTPEVTPPDEAPSLQEGVLGAPKETEVPW